MLEVVRTQAELRAGLALRRAGQGRVGLVATMGALHAGHRALLAAAADACSTTVLSVFVNPLQFDDAEDLAGYPRSLDADLRLAEDAGATFCFAPEAAAMYPSGRPQVVVDPGPLGAVLEGASRPGHFLGVATVVAKLLAAVQPDVAFFGEKDYQQLVLVRRLVADLSFPVEVVGVATAREPDGLAISSRNVRLSDEERRAAPVLHEALLAGRARILGGAAPSAAAGVMAERLAEEPLVVPDYAVVRAADDLREVVEVETPADLRLLVAARVGKVRLLDNLGARP